ncbi:MAG: hypothetical protein K6L73_05660 [Cellvibrionaceae bacterium]
MAMEQTTLRVGIKAEVERTFTEADIAEFNSLVSANIGNEVPEPLIAGMFSFLLGEELPGFGTNYLKQRMQFKAVAEPGEALVTSVEVSRIRADKDLVDLNTLCTGRDGRVICEGSALVLAKDTNWTLEES